MHTMRDFQELVRDIYFENDSQHQVAGVFLWFMTEVCEMSKELRDYCGSLERDDIKFSQENLEMEFGDVLVFLMSLMNLTGVNVVNVVERFKDGCPKCKGNPCKCP